MPFIIAIDGPSASGKGTIARRLAERFDFAYLDTGLLYRAVGLAVLRAGFDPENVEAATNAALNLDPAMLDNPELRGDAAAVAASKVGAIPAVRAALLKFQRDFCDNPPDGKQGAVLDGRDIGTVIAPHAEVKIYVTADVAVRANRRFTELQSRGLAAVEADVLADLRSRDERDATRAAAPAKPADDAIVLDTTDMTADEAVAEALLAAGLCLRDKKWGSVSEPH